MDSHPTAIAQQIANLKQLRLAVAARTRDVASRELSARVLRGELEGQHRAAGETKTDSEKSAKADPVYLDHERKTHDVTYERDVLLAEAESQRLEIQLLLVLEARVDLVEDL